jgi:hypothetical protein
MCYASAMLDASLIRCPFCGYETPMDYVHGHAQCLHCKTNIAPCCDGAPCDTTFDSIEDATKGETGDVRALHPQLPKNLVKN